MCVVRGWGGVSGDKHSRNTSNLFLKEHISLEKFLKLVVTKNSPLICEIMNSLIVK